MPSSSFGRISQLWKLLRKCRGIRLMWSIVNPYNRSLQAAYIRRFRCGHSSHWDRHQRVRLTSILGHNSKTHTTSWKRRFFLFSIFVCNNQVKKGEREWSARKQQHTKWTKVKGWCDVMLDLAKLLRFPVVRSVHRLPNDPKALAGHYLWQFAPGSQWHCRLYRMLYGIWPIPATTVTKWITYTINERAFMVSTEIQANL